MKEQIKKLEAEVEALFTLTVRAYGRFAFLRPLMRNKVLLRRISKERKGEGFARLRNWLYWALVLELNKICSDDDERTPSLKRITEKLKDEHLRKRLEDKYANNRHFEEAELRAEFDHLYSKYLRRAKKLLSSQSVGGYKTIRDKLISHNELRLSQGGPTGYDFYDVKEAKLKYGDERRLLSKLQGLVKLLLIIVRSVDFEWGTSVRIEEEAARKFWGISKRRLI
jgi:AbiU2